MHLFVVRKERLLPYEAAAEKRTIEEKKKASIDRSRSRGVDKISQNLDLFFLFTHKTEKRKKLKTGQVRRALLLPSGLYLRVPDR